MLKRANLPWLTLLALIPATAWAAAEPPLPTLPDVPAELKAEVEALRKPVQRYTTHCYARPIDRSDSEVPSDCAKLEIKLRATLKGAKPDVALHAILRHGVVQLVRATKAESTPDERTWQGSDDANAKLLAEFVAGGDAHTVAAYCVYAMRLGQQDDSEEAEYSSARERVMWLAWLTARATQAPYLAVPGVWDAERMPARKLARRWHEWWVSRQSKSSEELRKDGLAQTLAALADPDPLVRFWAASAVVDTGNAAARAQALWAVREALLAPDLGKAAGEAMDGLARRIPVGELLFPPPLAGKVVETPHLPPPLQQDSADPLDQPPAAVALPPVPAELKEQVAQLVPLYRKVAQVCWGDVLAGDGDTWTSACYDVLNEIEKQLSAGSEIAGWHAVARGLFVPLAEGKLKFPKKLKASGPVQSAQLTLARSATLAPLTQQIYAHVASVALARPNWSEGEAQLLAELNEHFATDGLAAAGLPIPWEKARPDELRASLQRQVVAWNLRTALAKDHQGKPWQRLSQQLARSGHLASRYRFACQPYWVDSKAERAEAVRLVRQVLLDRSLAPEIRENFTAGACSVLKPRDLLVGTPWPAAAVASGLLAAAEGPDEPAPLGCRAALQGWYAKQAVQACGSAVGDDGEPRADGLWAQLDAGEDPTRVQALVEPWLPRVKGPALGGLREVWAAAATAAGQRQPVVERLSAWLGGSTEGALADRLALLQGKPASPRWWLTAATGAQCTARHGAAVDPAWLARRGWIGGLPAFAKGIASLKPAQRREVDQRVASACPLNRSAAD